MNLRILHVAQSVDSRHGGPIEGIRQQALIHLSEDRSVEIASLDSPDSTYLSFPGVRVYPLKRFFVDLFIPFSLITWLCSNKSRYDIVVVNGIWGLHLFAVWLCLANSRIPYLVVTHGMLDPWFRKRYPLKHLKKWLLWPWGVYPALRDAAAVLFTCEQEKILARDSFWLYKCNERVINYGTEGIPTYAHNYASAFLDVHKTLQHKRQFLFLGRITPKKGVDILLHAIRILMLEGLWNSRDMVLTLAGPADNSYAIYISSLANQLGVTDSLYWTGMLSGDQKWGAFQSAEAFVLPSHQENFGIAVAESLSCGLPVLISNSVNIAPEVINDGAGISDTDDIDGVLRLFRAWFLLDQDSRFIMRTCARQCFVSRFHISNTMASIYSCMIKAISSKSPASPGVV